MAAAFDPETGEALFDPETGDVIQEGDTAAIARVLKKASPAVAPIGTKSKMGDFWVAKGDGPGRAAEVRTQNVRRGLATRKVPKGREGLMFDESRLAAARAADLAKWKSIGAPGDFDSWVEEQYAQETGRKPSGMATKALRSASDFVSGRNASGPISEIRSAVDAPLRGAMEVARKVIVRPQDYKDREARDLERYAEMRSGAPAPMGVTGTMKAIGDMAQQEGGLQLLASELINPDDMLLNTVSMLPAAGLAGKAATVAGRSATLATRAPRLARAAEAAGQLATTSRLAPLASIGADAAVGGALNAIQQNQNLEDDFAAGAIPGAILGGASMGLGKLSKPLGSRLFPAGEPPAAPALHPIQDRAKFKAAKLGKAISDLTPEELAADPIIFKEISTGKETRNNRDAVRQFVQEHGRKFVPDLDKFGGDPKYELEAVADAMTNLKPKEGAAPVRRGKQYTQADVDQALANYVPLSVGPDQIPEFLAAGKKGLLKTHYNLKRMKEQGLTPTGGGEIPLHPELDNVNALTQQVEAARAKKQGELDKQIAAAETDAEKLRLQEERRLNEENAKAQKDELEREGKITELSVKSRLAARGEDVIPGSLTTYLGKLKPEELGLIMDDELVGGGRFDDLMPVMADKMGLEFDELKNLRLATQGNEKLWAEGAKILLDQSKARLEASNKGAQVTMDQAVGQQAVREQVASMEDSAATREAMDETARTKAAEESSLIEEEFLSASDEDAAGAFRAVISKNPEKAELLGVKRSTIAAYTNPDNPFHKKAKKELDAKLVDAVKVARERGLPKGFF